MITNGGTVGLAEGIIDDTWIVLFYYDKDPAKYGWQLWLQIFILSIIQNGEFIPNFVPNSKRSLFWCLTSTLISWRFTTSFMPAIKMRPKNQITQTQMIPKKRGYRSKTSSVEMVRKSMVVQRATTIDIQAWLWHGWRCQIWQFRLTNDMEMHVRYRNVKTKLKYCGRSVTTWKPSASLTRLQFFGKTNAVSLLFFIDSSTSLSTHWFPKSMTTITWHRLRRTIEGRNLAP